MMKRKLLAVFAAICIAGTSLPAYGSEPVQRVEAETVSNLSKIDMSKWSYNSDSKVYYQTGISYCETPDASDYETLGIFIPAAYMKGTENSDGTYTCTINSAGSTGEYTGSNAPMVLPVNTSGYSAMKPPTGYTSNVEKYTSAGMIYIYAGCRGRDSGAPSGVTDLKAAIRYIRYNADILPGDTESIFSFGHSGGGAQSSLLGATGDSTLYTKYLEKIGAVSGVSDAVKGSMCWCPITNLDVADGAYEWNMGASRSDLSKDDQAVSDGLANSYASYINELGLQDSDGNILSLTSSDSGIFQSGTYYEYIKNMIETSLNHFLSDTTFPYTPSSSGAGGTGGNMPGGDMPAGDKPSGTPPSESMTEASAPSEAGSSENAGNESSTTYQTASDYINALNEKAGKNFITYDSVTNTATITSVADFAGACKKATKGLGAFDDIDEKGQAENQLFGTGNSSYAHFDQVLAELIKENDTYSKYYDEFVSDMAKTDALGTDLQTRMNMYNPMYYLEDYYDGYKTSNVAKFWRIRSGITQEDTALNTEVNLSLALQNYGELSVDFETVWGQGHTEAERTGDNTSNFISWVGECMKSTGKNSGTADEEVNYLAFGSDRHGDTLAIGKAMGGMPSDVEYVSAIGDMVGSGKSRTPEFNSSEIYNEIMALGFKKLISKEQVSILWASHDKKVTDDAGIVFGSGGSGSGLMYTGKNEDGDVTYYVYGIAFNDMKKAANAESAAKAFETWVDTITDRSIPVIVCCHMPLHYARKDNAGATAWNLALNYAATGYETTEASAVVSRNVIFLFGHNHTVESGTGTYSGEFFIPCESEMEIGTKENVWSRIFYTYTTAGYMKQNNTATLITIEQREIKLEKYQNSSVTNNLYDTKSKSSGVYANKYITKGTNTITKVSSDAKCGAPDAKAANPLLVTKSDAALKYSALKKKAQKIARTKVVTIRNSKGTVTYKKKSGNKKITVNSKTGKITVKKGLKKGSYKIKYKVIAAGTKYYKRGAKTVSVKINIS